MYYIIHSKSERGFWSNRDGWVYSAYSATKYNEEQYNEYKDILPLSKLGDAEWMVYEYAE